MIRLATQIAYSISSHWPGAFKHSVEGIDRHDFTLEEEPLILVTVSNLNPDTIIVTCFKNMDPKAGIGVKMKIKSNGVNYLITKFLGTVYTANKGDDIPSFIVGEILRFIENPEHYRE